MKNPKNLKTIIIALLITISFMALPSLAKVNLSRFDYLKKNKGIYGSLNLAFMYNRGQENILQLETTAGIGYNAGNLSTLVIGRSMYAEKDDTTYLNQNYLHIRTGWKLYKFITVEAFYHMENDRFNLVKDKRSLGMGARFALTKADANGGKKHKLKVDAGIALLWDTEEYYQVDGQTVRENLDQGKSTVYLSINWNINKIVSFSSISHIFNSLEKAEDFDWNWQVALSTAISKSLSLVTKAYYAYENDPAPTVKNSDFTLTAGINLKF